MSARDDIIAKAGLLIDGRATWEDIDLHVEELIALLLSEIARLRAEAERLHGMCQQTAQSLQDEETDNDRLRTQNAALVGAARSVDPTALPNAIIAYMKEQGS